MTGDQRVTEENLGGLGVVQVPELDVAVAGGHKVRAVVREGDSGNLTGHLIGCNHDVFLINKQQKQGVSSIL